MYVCASCKVPTDRGALICYADEIVVVPLCPLHMRSTAKFFEDDGVPVVSAEKMN
jgi:hypothetical protein